MTPYEHEQWHKERDEKKAGGDFVFVFFIIILPMVYLAFAPWNWPFSRHQCAVIIGHALVEHAKEFK